MSYSKDYDYIANRYITIKDLTAPCGELMFYERNDIDRDKTPTECIICIEAENEMYSKYAHPKAHLESHEEANVIAEKIAIKEKKTEEYIEYYTFYYGKEYRKIYKDKYKKFKEEYSAIILERTYDKNDKICDHHLESIQYHFELKNSEEHINPEIQSNVDNPSLATYQPCLYY